MLNVLWVEPRKLMSVLGAASFVEKGTPFHKTPPMQDPESGRLTRNAQSRSLGPVLRLSILTRGVI